MRRDRKVVASLCRHLSVLEDHLRDGLGRESLMDWGALLQKTRATEQAAQARPPSSLKKHAEAGEPGPTERLTSLCAEIADCQACPLAKTRMLTVPGEGPCPAPVMVIGEGPGSEEDKTGRPFVGAAGQLLEKMLASIGLDRKSNCYITNMVKCRPPYNRDPEPEELAACRAYLNRQIKLVQPKLLLCLGRVATRSLLGSDLTMASLRGKWHTYQGPGFSLPLLGTYHPSALLRDGSLKRLAWEDLKQVRAKLNS